MTSSPLDDESMAPPVDVSGYAAPGYEGVLAEFQKNFVHRGDLGAAFAAVVDGRKVIDVWGGYANGDNQDPWRARTVAGIFSGSKGLVAVCMLLLIERGLLDLDKPVSHYWPDFAAAGKGDILVRHVMSHQAGLPGIEKPVTIEEAADHRKMAGLLAEQRAVTPPGRTVCYHALTFGWLCGALLERIDGRTLGQFLNEEVAVPLNLDVWIGLPEAEERRVATFETYPDFDPIDRESLEAPAPGSVSWSIWSNPPRFVNEQLAVNSRAWRAGEVPASNGVADARSMARLYGCLALGGSMDEVTLLRPDTIALGRELAARGTDPYLGEDMAFGVGLALQTDLHAFGPPPDAFGHGGAGGSMHGAWPSQRAGFSYITNRLAPGNGQDRRAQALLEALFDAVESPDQATVRAQDHQSVQEEGQP